MPIDEAYYQRVREASLKPVWSREARPRRRAVPYIWRWDLMERMLREAAQDNGLDEIGHRRALSMVNPGFNGEQHGTISTASAAIQLIKPGEVATAHRHPAAALRFIMVGSDAYTIVEGEKAYMEEGDLVLTPTMMYHDHAHAGMTNEDMVWMDVLESPLGTFLEVLPGDDFPEDVQPVTKPAGWSASFLGGGAMRAFGQQELPRTLPLAYKMADAYAALLDSTVESPFDGVAMEYINPLNNGHALPTIQCSLQRLRAGEHTRTHRHNHGAVYNVHKGHGFSVVDGIKIEWQTHDVFCVPPGAWHEHANLVDNDDAVLFSISDFPLVEAADWVREEEGTYQEVRSAI